MADFGRRAIDVASGVLLAAVLAATLLQVAARYVFNWSVPWSEELTRLIFVWMVMIAAVGSAHMRIDFIVDQAQPAVRRGLRLAIAALCIGILGLMVWQSFGIIDLTRNDRYVALGISVQYLYWSVPVGCGLWALAIAAAAARDFRDRT